METPTTTQLVFFLICLGIPNAAWTSGKNDAMNTHEVDQQQGEPKLERRNKKGKQHQANQIAEEQAQDSAKANATLNPKSEIHHE
jgi:hypothetical protein